MHWSTHSFIMHYLMKFSHIEIDHFEKASDDHQFKCHLNIGEGQDRVRIILQYLGFSEDDSWIASSGIIGLFNTHSDLIHMLDYLHSNTVPSYALTLDKHSRVISLTRSMRMRNLDWQAMHELTSGLAEMIRNLQHIANSESLICQ
ncbi:MAG: hypothetical protein JXR78_17190 [Victivallales bacterium]|nr:hypothetical protein [Victivallales bacterium]